ncbi:MAG: hypothetical protein H7141_01475 [Burkholderiales bacterium]|nr:hypothetical protein [Bacteroidia bacterium]
MLTIRPYYTEDHTKLLPLLKNFDPAITDTIWQKLLDYKWENKLGYRGMLLENEGSIVGFLSYILYQKEVKSLETTFCNISTWIVNPEFRSKSLQLLSPLFKIKNIVILNLSPHENTLSVFNALRFDMLSEYEYLINPYKLKLSFLFIKNKASVNYQSLNEQNINKCDIDDKTKQLIKDHSQYKNIQFYRFIISKNGNENTLILAFNQKEIKPEVTRDKVKELPYKLLNRIDKLELLYSSSADFLIQYFIEVMHSLIFNTKARSINISEHFTNKTNLNVDYVAKNKKDRSWFFYSENEIELAEINLLYTEKVLLNF